MVSFIPSLKGMNDVSLGSGATNLSNNFLETPEQPILPTSVSSLLFSQPLVNFSDIPMAQLNYKSPTSLQYADKAYWNASVLTNKKEKAKYNKYA